MYAMDKTKAPVSRLPNDAKLKGLITQTKALETFIKQTDAETIPSKRQRRVTSLAADCEEEFKICEALSDKKVELKVIVLLSSTKCFQEWIVIMGKVTYTVCASLEK